MAHTEVFALRAQPRIELLRAAAGELVVEAVATQRPEPPDQQIRAWLIAFAIEHVVVDRSADEAFAALVSRCAESLGIPVSAEAS
jgi:hypothetical protein